MSLKNELERELGVPIRLRAGAPGSLTVLADDERIYSKKQTGRSPDVAELVELIRAKTRQK